MADRPILFSAPMVQALLAGTKTQTRRIVKPRGRNSLFEIEEDGTPMWTDSYILDPGNAEWRMRDNRYGVPGDTLYVRETWSFIGKQGIFDLHQAQPDTCRPIYRADGVQADRWWPSIHMPRWASRISLKVTDVRAERLQDISEADALAEGVSGSGDTEVWPPCAKAAYQDLWEQINGPGSWADNPWVWAVSFEVEAR